MLVKVMWECLSNNKFRDKTRACNSCKELTKNLYCCVELMIHPNKELIW